MKIWVLYYILLVVSSLTCMKCLAQENYAIVAESSLDSTICAIHCPFFDFDSQEIIVGSSIPDQLVTSVHGSMNEVQEATKHVLETAFRFDSKGLPVSLYVVIDSIGAVRGIVTNVTRNNKLPLAVAKVALDYLKTMSFNPATLRGRPIVSGFSLFIRLKEESEIGTRWSYESMPSFDHDGKQKKLYKLINENLAQFDTLTKTETVYVRFLVDTLGATHQHKVMKGVNPQLDEEALRVCRLIKFDHPAMQGGKPAETFYTVPIRFEPPQAQPITKKRCVFWRKKKK